MYNIGGTYNYLTINPNGSNTYVIGSPTQAQNTYYGVNSSGVEYAVKTTTLDEANGGGFCQVDAIFATVSGGTAYFAVVTDSNPNGTSWDGYTPARFGPGDLSVTTTSGTYGVGARPIDLETAYGSINYGTTDARDPASWASYVANASKTSFTTNYADVVKSPTWSHVDNEGGDESNMTLSAYFLGNTGAFQGFASASWNLVNINGTPTPYVGFDQPETGYADPDMEPYSTWVYEVAVPLTDLGLSSNAPLQALDSISFAPDCGNDSLTLTPIVGAPPAVPEPVAAIFFGTGLIAVGGFVAKRRMLRKA